MGEKGEVIRCLRKGARCAWCDERYFCRDIEVVRATMAFQDRLFDRIVRGLPINEEEESCRK